MISAKEAREQAFLMHHEHELEEIERRVLSAIHNNVAYIYVSDSLHPSTIEKLKQLGYQVMFCDGGQREPDLWKIYWGEREE